MKFLKRPQLILVLSAFVTVFCRCSLTPGTPVTLSLADGNSIECLEFFENDPNWSNLYNSSYTYDCSITCPDGSLASIKAMRLPNGSGTTYVEGEIVELELALLQEQYCALPTTATEPATEAPAPPLSAGESQVTSIPFLTGKITACDYKAGFINFERADADQEYSRENLQVALNQQTVDCGVPNNNLDVLSCDLPAGVRFPINVQVQVAQVQVNDFSFDGAFCGYKDPGSADGNSTDENGGSGGVPACDPHLDPNCSVDCSNPANVDLCH